MRIGEAREAYAAAMTEFCRPGARPKWITNPCESVLISIGVIPKGKSREK